MYVFAVVKSNLPVPVPSFSIPPAPLIALETVIPPLFVVPKLKLALAVIPPAMVKVFVPDVISVFILEAEATVIVPDKVAAAAELLMNLIAPVLLAPVPLIEIASGIVSVDAALISNAALFPIVVVDNPEPPAAELPKASAFVIWTIPDVIEVVPA